MLKPAWVKKKQTKKQNSQWEALNVALGLILSTWRSEKPCIAYTSLHVGISVGGGIVVIFPPFVALDRFSIHV